MKAHVVRQHSQRQDLVPQLEAPSSLTPSSELSNPGQSELTNIDISALFSDAPANSNSSASGPDEALNSGILTIDVTSVSSSLGKNLPANDNSLGPMDPLVLVAHSDIHPSADTPLVLGTSATVLQPGGFGVEDVQAVSPGTVGCLVALPMKNLSQEPPALTSRGNLAAHFTTSASSGISQETASAPELVTAIKVEQDSLLPDMVEQQEGSLGPSQSVFSSPTERHGAQKDTELSAGTGNLFLLREVGLPRFSEYKWCVVNGLQESGGSARTDYRAIQLAKEKKQKGTGNDAGASESAQGKIKGSKISPHFHASQNICMCGNLAVPSGGRPALAPVTGVQCIQIPVLQDDPSGEGVLPLALSPQPPTFHPYFTMDLPVYVLQEVLPAPGAVAGPEAAQVPGSTINLRDLQ